MIVECLAVASTFWLSFEPMGMDAYEYASPVRINVEHIASIDSEGTIRMNPPNRMTELNIWDKENNRYVTGDEIFAVLSTCDNKETE